MEKFLNIHNRCKSENKEVSVKTSGRVVKRRKYDNSYLNFGFTSIEINDEVRPQCVLCMKILARESMIPSKLKRHLKTNHSDVVGKSSDYFTAKLKELKQQKEIYEDLDESDNISQPSCDQQSSQSSPTPGRMNLYLLKKESHCTTILDQLLQDDTFCDVTLTAEGQSMRAHKLVLCFASDYFRQVLSKNSNIQNVIIFRDIRFTELKNLLTFIYTGEATVDAAELESFMKTAEMLEVTSLYDSQQILSENLIPRPKVVKTEKHKTNFAVKRAHDACGSFSPAKSRRIEESSIIRHSTNSVPPHPSTCDNDELLFCPRVILTTSKTDPTVEEDPVDIMCHSIESQPFPIPMYHQYSDIPSPEEMGNDSDPLSDKAPVGKKKMRTEAGPSKDRISYQKVIERRKENSIYTAQRNSLLKFLKIEKELDSDASTGVLNPNEKLKASEIDMNEDINRGNND